MSSVSTGNPGKLWYVFINNSFTQNGKNFEVPKGGRRLKGGLESASKKSEGFRIAHSDDRGSP
jgi:hypothetical protein